MTDLIHKREIWGAILESDAPVDDVMLEGLKREIADALSSVEKWDLKVETISVSGLAAGADEVMISAMPESQYMAPEGERTLSDFTPSVIRKCRECGRLWPVGRVHPDSDCLTGIVDGIMNS